MTFHYQDKKEYSVSAEVPPPSWWELVKKYAPWILAGGAVIGSVVYVATRRARAVFEERGAEESVNTVGSQRFGAVKVALQS